MRCDVVIVGAGPAGIFTALELLKKGSKKRIIMWKRASRRKTELPQKHHQRVRQLQTILPDYHGIFRSRSVFRR